MKNFTYVNAPDKKAALDKLAEANGKGWLAAGCTNILINIKNKMKNDKEIINIKYIKELRGIEEKDGKIVIGALTTIKDLEESKLIAEKAPALHQGACVFADPTIRHTATIGGNISDASPAADTAPALLALEAVITIEKKGGSRQVPISEFFQGVNKTVVEPDEMVTYIEFEPNPNSSFVKVGLRKAMAISVISAAAAVKYNGKVEKATVAMGSVAPKPVRCENTEKAIVGKDLEQDNLTALEDALAKDISPISDVRASGDYRKAIAGTVVERALKAAAGVCCSHGGGNNE